MKRVNKELSGMNVMLFALPSLRDTIQSTIMSAAAVVKVVPLAVNSRRSGPRRRLAFSALDEPLSLPSCRCLCNAGRTLGVLAAMIVAACAVRAAVPRNDYFTKEVETGEVDAAEVDEVVGVRSVILANPNVKDEDKAQQERKLRERRIRVYNRKLGRLRVRKGMEAERRERKRLREEQMRMDPVLVQREERRVARED